MGSIELLGGRVVWFLYCCNVCSDELMCHLENDVMPAIKQVQNAMAENDAKSSEYG